MKLNRLISYALCVSIIGSTFSLNAYADKAQVSTDEAAYAKLDYYGKITDLSVVKGVSLNGINNFTDYGEYSKVTNMSSDLQPEINDDSVTWNIPGENDKKRFYYECVPKDLSSVNMPWTFDISYKLNGVPTDADKLKGASGLVDIEIKATPNENMPDYYKNNIVLQIMSLSDMEKTLSVEAPGAQIQSMGTYKAVVFFVLPGEEKTVNIRIGTDSFETDGVEMAMIPGTLDTLDKIKQIKEVKDKVQDSFDSINDSLNSVLTTFKNMGSSLSNLKNGINSLNNIINNMTNSEDEINGNTDELIEKMSILSSEISNTIPYFSKASQCINDTNNDVNNIVDTMSELKNQAQDYRDCLNKLKRDLARLQKILDKSQDLNDDASDAIDDLSDDLNRLRKTKRDFKNSLDKLSDLGQDSSDNLSDIESAIEKALGISSDSNINNVGNQSLSIIKKLKKAISGFDDMNDGLKDFLDYADDLNKDLQDILDIGTDYLKLANNAADNAENIAEATKKITDNLKKSADIADRLMENVETLNETANNYYTDSLDMVDDMKELSEGMNGVVDSITGLINSIQDILVNNEGELKNSRNDSIQAALTLIEKSIDLTKSSDDINNSNNTIHDAVNNELDDTESDSNVLNMDNSENFVSFTSDKNPSPESIQIIVRTEEIKIDDDDDGSNDLEKSADDEGILTRIINIFKKIVNYFK